MFLLGFRRKLTALALCKSIESAIQWFQIHHSITFATMQKPAVYLSGARVSIFSTLVPRLLYEKSATLCKDGHALVRKILMMWGVSFVKPIVPPCESYMAMFGDDV